MTRPRWQWTDLALRVRSSAVAWSFMTALARVGGAMALLPLVLRYLPPEQLGLWYVFTSLGALASLLDFGLSPSISRAAGYLWAGAEKLLPTGFAVSTPTDQTLQPNLNELARLQASARHYYHRLGLVILVGLLSGGGWWIWIKTEGFADPLPLRLAWLAYSSGVFYNVCCNYWIPLLGGVNGVRQAQQVTALGLLANVTVAAIALVAGLGLWSMVIGYFLMGIIVRTMGRREYLRIVARPDTTLPSPEGESMIRLLWPVAWRTGLSGLGGFLVVQANTLICSGTLDLKTTASYGLSMQLTSLLASISSVWVQVKLPVFNQLRTQGKQAEIAQLFAQRVRLTIATYLVGAAAIFWVAPLMLAMIGTKTPLLPSPMLAALLVVMFLEAHHNQYASLVLTENANPFVIPSLVSGALVVGASLWLTPRFAVWGMILASGFVQAGFNNWWPVVRAVAGLHPVTSGQYWRMFFGFPRHITTASK